MKPSLEPRDELVPVELVDHDDPVGDLVDVLLEAPPLRHPARAVGLGLPGVLEAGLLRRQVWGGKVQKKPCLYYSTQHTLPDMTVKSYATNPKT